MQRFGGGILRLFCTPHWRSGRIHMPRTQDPLHSELQAQVQELSRCRTPCIVRETARRFLVSPTETVANVWLGGWLTRDTAMLVCLLDLEQLC